MQQSNQQKDKILKSQYPQKHIWYVILFNN